jgi:hypothetical protein
MKFMDRNNQIISFHEGLGIGAYIFGGIILFFAAIFLFIEMYTAMVVCLLPALFLIGYRRKVLIDLMKKEVCNKWGFFIPFITKKTSSISEAKAVVISRHVSKARTSMRSVPTDYHIEIELPQSKVSVWEFYEHDKAFQLAKELAERLKVNYYQGSETNF